MKLIAILLCLLCLAAPARATFIADAGSTTDVHLSLSLTSNVPITFSPSIEVLTTNVNEITFAPVFAPTNVFSPSFAPGSIVYEDHSTNTIIQGNTAFSNTTIVTLDDSWEVDLSGSLQPVASHAGRAITGRGSNTTDLGTASKPYSNLFVTEVILDKVQQANIPKPTGTSDKILQAQGTNVYWGNLYGPTPVGIGTNRVTFSNIQTGGVSYTWTVPAGVTNTAWYLWGAGGWGVNATLYGGGAGFYYALMTVIPGATYDIYLGNGGSGTNLASAYPGGGACRSSTVNTAGGGGGWSGVFYGGTTNPIMVVGSGSGCSGTAGSAQPGAPGGGISGANGLPALNSNCVSGLGATAINIFSGHMTPTNGNPVPSLGGYLLGGSGSTNGYAVATFFLAGAGAGYQGGNGGSLTGNISTAYAGAGGGNSWADSNSVTFASTTRGIGRTPAGQELPQYLSGRGVGGASAAVAGGGLIVVEY